MTRNHVILDHACCLLVIAMKTVILGWTKHANLVSISFALSLVGQLVSRHFIVVSVSLEISILFYCSVASKLAASVKWKWNELRDNHLFMACHAIDLVSMQRSKQLARMFIQFGLQLTRITPNKLIVALKRQDWMFRIKQ